MAQHYGGGDWNEYPSFERKNVSMNAAHDRLPIPVTISKLTRNMGENEDTYNLGMYRFTTVQIVGTVEQVKEECGNSTYVLSDPDDQNSTFTVVKYNSEKEVNRLVDDLIVVNLRVRAIGKLKQFDGLRILMVYSMKEYSDEKDYIIFKQEARVSELFFEKNVIEKIREGKLNDSFGLPCMLSPPAPVLKRRLSDEPLEKKMKFEQVSHPSFDNYPSTSNNVVVATTTRHFDYKGPKAKIYGIFMKFASQNEYNEQTGVPITKIYEKMGNMPRQMINKFMEEMESDGSIFLVDDNDNYWIIE